MSWMTYLARIDSIDEQIPGHFVVVIYVHSARRYQNFGNIWEVIGFRDDFVGGFSTLIQAEPHNIRMIVFGSCQYHRSEGVVL